MFFKKKIILYIVVIVLLIITGLLFYINNSISNLIAAVGGSIVVSIIVSSIYNEELQSAMDKYQKIGLFNYFENFEDAQNEIRIKISKAKEVDIYVMYGDSFFNTSSKALNSLLSKENSILRCFTYSKSNKFIDAFGSYWGDEQNDSEYTADGIKNKLDNVLNLIKRFNENKNKLSTLELYEIQNAPISNSFYVIDGELYFVPNKNLKSKESKPAVFHFKRTNDETTMFSKIKNDLTAMIENKEVIKVEL